MRHVRLPEVVFVVGAMTVAAFAMVQGQEQGRPPTPREQFEAIQSEWQAAAKKEFVARKEAKTVAEKKDVFDKMGPDPVAYARRLLALAESRPGDPGARDALLWIVLHEQYPIAKMPFQLRLDPSDEVLGRAVDLLVEHHANDLQVARTAMFLSSAANVIPSFTRDRLFRPLFEGARERQVKGSATLALAQYLDRKSSLAANRRRSAMPIPGPHVEYTKHLLTCDPEAMRAEALRLLEQVIANFGDVPYVRARGGETYVSDLGLSSRATMDYDLAQKLTLAQAAEAQLDLMLNLAIGKPAPEIEGVDIKGKPLRLSDYRGKVVVLVFWGTWCAPCMAEVPHERALAERLKDQPFALLGIDCKDEKKTARNVMERERITWPNWYDGATDESIIAQRYHVTSFPTTFVLDAKGTIRAKGSVRGANLDSIVDTLLREKTPQSPAAADAP